MQVPASDSVRSQRRLERGFSLLARDLGLHPESRGEPLQGLKQEKGGGLLLKSLLEDDPSNKMSCVE